MSEHTCRTITRGCYRCDLNLDEVRTIKRRDYKRTTRLWGLCEICRYRWGWNGPTENVASGIRMIRNSACGCTRVTA